MSSKGASEPCHGIVFSPTRTFHVKIFFCLLHARDGQLDTGSGVLKATCSGSPLVRYKMRCLRRRSKFFRQKARFSELWRITCQDFLKELGVSINHRLNGKVLNDALTIELAKTLAQVRVRCQINDSLAHRVNILV